jgi:hypothetical protein
LIKKNSADQLKSVFISGKKNAKNKQLWKKEEPNKKFANATAKGF